MAPSFQFPHPKIKQLTYILPTSGTPSTILFLQTSVSSKPDFCGMSRIINQSSFWREEGKKEIKAFLDFRAILQLALQHIKSQILETECKKSHKDNNPNTNGTFENTWRLLVTNCNMKLWLQCIDKKTPNGLFQSPLWSFVLSCTFPKSVLTHEKKRLINI